MPPRARLLVRFARIVIPFPSPNVATTIPCAKHAILTPTGISSFFSGADGSGIEAAPEPSTATGAKFDRAVLLLVCALWMYGGWGRGL